jgi:N-acetyl-gamma-glutamyl-phosphate reductase
MITVGVIGARGHVGAELLPLLAYHPQVEIAAISSRALAGKPVEGLAGLTYVELTPESAAEKKLDAWILALPNGEAASWVARIANAREDAIFVDVSADHRFDPSWRYGLPELHRSSLKGAKRIANPGCYATALQLALAPFVDNLDGPAQVFGVSGYSGAGTTPSPRNDPEALRDNLMPYGLTGHLHEREAAHHLGCAVRFVPHVAGFFRGISLTLSFSLKTPRTDGELFEIASARYHGEPLVRVQREIPLLRDNAKKHHAVVGGFTVADGGKRAVVVATIDNLLKGAATQALQNLNLACSLDERTGIPL